MVRSTTDKLKHRMLASRAAMHGALVSGRRNRLLSVLFSRMLPEGATLLDVGCGDGQITATVQALRPDIVVTGLDVEVRRSAVIRVLRFDGRHIPLANGEQDVVLLCDVLHHTEVPAQLLREARRVARHGVLIKDHLAEGPIDRMLLALMDRFGNPSSVPQPHNYLSEAQWTALWEEVGLAPQQELVRSLQLYPQPFDLLFGRHLHFAALLSDAGREA